MGEFYLGRLAEGCQQRCNTDRASGEARRHECDQSHHHAAAASPPLGKNSAR